MRRLEGSRGAGEDEDEGAGEDEDEGESEGEGEDKQLGLADLPSVPRFLPRSGRGESRSRTALFVRCDLRTSDS
jgi:hypothetical protein